MQYIIHVVGGPQPSLAPRLHEIEIDRIRLCLSIMIYVFNFNDVSCSINIHPS